MTRQVRMAIIGCGGIASLHAQACGQVAGVELVACADVDESRARAFADEFDVPDAVADYRELLDRDDIKAVDITVPTFVHAEVAVAAAEAGKHVLCEKPIAMTLADADAIIGAARAADVKLMVAFARRFSAQWRTLGRIITGGEIGRPVVWREVDSGAGPLRDPDRPCWHLDAERGGGPFIDNWIHHYDFARVIFGEPVWAWASLRTMKTDSTSLDTGTCIVQFEAGDQLMVSSSWGLPGRGHHDCRGGSTRDVLGPRGAIVPGPSESEQPHFAVNSEGKQSRAVGYERETSRDYFAAEIAHFAQCVVEDRELSRPECAGAERSEALHTCGAVAWGGTATGEDGRRALEIGLAILQSSETGERVYL